MIAGEKGLLSAPVGFQPVPVGFQPGGRSPAPGRLALVQAFMNSYYDLEHEHGAELLGDPAALRKWFVRRGLLAARSRVSRAEHERALKLRETLRILARANSDARSPDARPLEQLNDLAHGAAAGVRFTSAGPMFVRPPSSGVGGALGVLLADTATAMLGGDWWRLKICPGDDCGWAFYDHSRNQSGRWCSMAVCGGRAKARAHYRRRREA